MAQRDLARLVVRLEAQTGKYVRELDKANAKLQGFEAATKRGLSAIDTAFKRILTGAAVAALARSVTNLSDQYTQLQNALKVTGLEGRSLEAVQARLFAAANKNGVEINALADLYRRSSLAARELGASQSQLLEFVDGVTAALRIQGGSTAAASGALLQLSQALGSGTVRAEEFNSILEGALPIAQAVAQGIDKYGGSVAKLRAAILAGEVSSREFFEGFLKGSKGLEAQAARTNLTIAQSFTNLRTALIEVVGRFTSTTGISTGLASAIEALAKNIDNLARTLAVAAVTAGVFAVTLQAERILKSARAFIELFSAVASGRAILLGSVAVDRAKAAASVDAARAEVARTSAVLAATRAEQAKALVVADAVVADLARAAAARQVAALEAQAAAAQIALSKAQSQAAKTAAAGTGALALVFARLPAPIKAVFALIRAHPIGALVSAIAAAVTALVVFADKIKTSEDGVITLRDTAIAAWQLLTEGIAPIGRAVADTFARIRDTVTSALDLIRERFSGLIELAQDVGSALRTALNPIPVLAQRLAGAAFDKVQERARQIAEQRRAGAAGPPDTSGAKPPAAAPGDAKALKAIQDLEKALRQQIVTQRDGAVATIQYRIAQGDLADEFKKAGAAGDPYRRTLVSLTSQLEALKLQDLSEDLQRQVGAYNLTGAAALRYRLELGDLAQTVRDAGAAGRKFAEDAIVAADALERLQLDSALKDINAEILELRGNTADAFRIRLEVENRERRTKFTNLGDSAGLAQLDELEKLKVAQAEINALETEAGRIRDELAIQEQRITTNREVGALTEIAALEKISAAREVSVAQLDTVLNKMRAIAEESGNPALIRNVQQMGAEFERLASQVNLVGQAIQSSFEEAAEGPLTEFLLGLQSAEDAVQSFFKTIEREIAQFVARDLIRRMFGDLFTSLTSGGGGGSSSGWIGQLIGGIVGLIGGPATAAAGSSAVPTNFSGPREMGGPVMAGNAYLVGERGPEVMVPRDNGVIVPNHDLRGLMRDQRPVEVVNNFTIQAPQGTVSRQTQSQVAAAAARGVFDANRRNN